MNVEQHGGGFVIFRDDSASSEIANSAATRDRDFIDHIRSREFAERAAAKHATCDRARQLHQELAQAYARMIRRAGGQ